MCTWNARFQSDSGESKRHEDVSAIVDRVTPGRRRDGSVRPCRSGGVSAAGCRRGGCRVLEMPVEVGLKFGDLPRDALDVIRGATTSLCAVHAALAY